MQLNNIPSNSSTPILPIHPFIQFSVDKSVCLSVHMGISEAAQPNVGCGCHVAVSNRIQAQTQKQTGQGRAGEGHMDTRG